VFKADNEAAVGVKLQLSEVGIMDSKDEYGSYTVIDRWVSAWRHPYPGFALNEFRGYEGGDTRVHTSAAVYIADHPEMADMYESFLRAQGELMAFIDAK
jgi:hypothetical protein